jgi:D-sedoheptulose 7-phosphate isomerase
LCFLSTNNSELFLQLYYEWEPIFVERFRVEEKILKLFEEAAQAALDCGKKNASLISRMARELIACFEQGGKLLIFGNGGSAAHAQHFAAELVNKLSTYRKPLPAIAITADSSILTSIGNDLAFEEVFSRQIEAFGRNGDVAWCMTTSGTSPNLIKACNKAREMGIFTITFSGRDGGTIAHITDLCLTVPLHDTARIQEVHLCAGHAICALVEEHFLAK